MKSRLPGRRALRRHPLATGLAACAAVVGIESAVWVAQTAWHVIPLLLAVAFALAGYRLGQRSRVLPPRGRVLQGTVIRTPDLSGEVARLQAENARLRAELADARESAQRAWDAASSVPPRPASPVPGEADRLLAQPYSGVWPLSGGGQ